MKKRVVALCLVIALIAGSVPTITLAQSSTPTYLAAYSGSVTVDGSMKEAAWVTDGQLSDATAGRNFGVLWDGEYLYLGVVPQAGDHEISVTLGQDVLTVTPDGANGIAGAISVWGSAVEMKIPYAVNSYSQRLNLNLAMGTMEWSGEICFDSYARTNSYSMGFRGASEDAIGITDTADGFTMYRKYVAGASYGSNRVYAGQFDVIPLGSETSPATLEFSFQADKLPTYGKADGNAIAFKDNIHVCDGMSIVMADWTDRAMDAGITNTEDGLYFVLNQGLSGSKSVAVCKLNKQVGDSFSIRLDWALNGSVKLYVDHVLLKEFAADTRYSCDWSGQGNKTLMFNLYTPGGTPAADGSQDVEMTVSNVRLGNTQNTSVVDSLDFSDIANGDQTEDKVLFDLHLPTTWSNGQLKNAPLTWTSSNPDVVSTSGKVTPTAKNEEVTLTVSETNDPSHTKTFMVTVRSKPMDVRHTTETITLDGKMEEASWHMPSVFAVSEGYDAKVYPLWSAGVTYLAVTHNEAESMTVTIDNIVYTVNLKNGKVTGGNGVTVAVTEGVAELKIEMAKAGIPVHDYNQLVNLQIELTGSNGTASLGADPVLLQYISTDVVPFIPTTSGSWTVADGIAAMSYTGEANNTSTNNHRNYYFFWSNAVTMDHSKDQLLEMTLKIENMPAGGGAVGGSGGNGLNIWMSYNQSKSAHGVLISDENGNLSMDFRGTGSIANVNWNNVIALGKKQGETFRLGILWTANDYVHVYVDGKEIASKYIVLNWTSGWHGNNVVALDYRAPADTTETTKIQFTDVIHISMVNKYNSILEEVTKAAVLPGVNLDGVTSNLNLPESYASQYLGQIPLSWKSSNPGLLSNTGVVTQPDGGSSAYVDLTLSAFDQVLWTEQVSILPAGEAAAEHTIDKLLVPYTGAAVVMDGLTTDEGWNMNTKVLNAAESSVGTFGVQWDRTNLYLAVKSTEQMSMVINGKTVALDDVASQTNGNVTEYQISLAELGITIADYNQEVSAKIVIGEGTWEGTLVLTSTDWFTTGNCAPETPFTICGSQGWDGLGTPTANQGYAKIEGGYYLFDHYDQSGNNPIQIRTYVILMGQENKTPEILELMQPMNDRTKATYAEFDFYATSMPEYRIAEITNFSTYYASHGLNWALSDQYDSGKNSNNVVLSITNTANGLVLVGASADGVVTVDLNKKVGDYFRIGTRWETDGSVSVFVDGEKIAVMENMEVKRNQKASNAFQFDLIRSKTAAASESDDFDIYITNFALGKSYGDSIYDSLTIDKLLGTNTDPMKVEADLTLPSAVFSEQMQKNFAVTWETTDATVVAVDGRVTRPGEQGKLVTLTASSGAWSKRFEVYVTAENYNSDILVATGDKNPSQGVGTQMELYQYTLDTGNNSIIKDQGEKKQVNAVVLKDGDETNRLNENVLTLWVSDDNVTYTQVDSFKLLRAGQLTYLYDFQVNARYIKVHCTHFDGKEADFTGLLQDMIQTSYEEVFGANGAAFANESTVSVTNSADYVKYDDAWAINPKEAGIVTFKEDRSDVRFFLNGELLYHYFDGQNFQVRIPEVAAGADVTLKVCSGNAQAMDISNQEYVHEVVYGTVEGSVAVTNAGRWLLELPNDVLMSFDDCAVYYSLSYDGGMSWTAPKRTGASFSGAGGAVYDSHTGRIIVQGFDLGQYVAGDVTQSDCKVCFIASDDMGETWYALDDIAFDGKAATYFLSYTDPQELSTYDGTGPNVDLVLPCGVQYDNNGAFCARVAYSKDGGTTWRLSASEITYDVKVEDGVATSAEAGVSEGTIMEGMDEDGTPALVLYARCQYENSKNFVRTYSYDGGVTWTAPVEFSDVYTSNTQPILFELGGETLMLWGGNNTLGGNSYQRYPMSIAVSRDGLQTFENIMDLYSRYSLQGLTEATGNRIVNQSVASSGSALLIAWRNWSTNEQYNNAMMNLRIDDFEKYFYRNKGAFDSFENSSVKYEGWSVTTGAVTVSDAQYSDGDKSMLMNGGSVAVRSIPYIQDGTIAFDLYVPNTNANLSIELASAFSNRYGEASPIALQIRNGALTFRGADAASGITLKQGWNTVVFDLKLTQGVATVRVNDQDASVPVDTELGDYVTYVNISADTSCHVDAFLVRDDAPVVIHTDDGTDDPSDQKMTITGSAIDSNVATVTAPAGGWVEGENTFTVTADVACVVAVSNDGGQTYTRLTAVGSGNTYSFTVNLTADSQIAVVVAGDTNGDGDLDVSDAAKVKAALLGQAELGALGELAADVNYTNDMDVSDIARLKAVLLGEAELTWAN